MCKVEVIYVSLSKWHGHNIPRLFPFSLILKFGGRCLILLLIAIPGSLL
jgi:hypothetical protein